MPLQLIGGTIRSAFGGISKHAVRRARAVASTKQWKQAHPNYQRDWFRAHPEYKKRYRERRNAHPENAVKDLILEARARCRRNSMACTITLSDLLPLPTVCPVLGLSLNYRGGNGRGTGRVNDNSPSLDRIDNSKGYVPGNVMLISWRANRIKADASIEELKKVLAYLERTQKG